MLRKDGKIFEDQVFVVEEAVLDEHGEFKCVHIVAVCKERRTAREHLKDRVNRIHEANSDKSFNIFGKNGSAEIMFEGGETYRLYTTIRQVF